MLYAFDPFAVGRLKTLLSMPSIEDERFETTASIVVHSTRPCDCKATDHDHHTVLAIYLPVPYSKPGGKFGIETINITRHVHRAFQTVPDGELIEMQGDAYTQKWLIPYPVQEAIEMVKSFMEKVGVMEISVHR